jgi:hypothetical protein
MIYSPQKWSTLAARETQIYLKLSGVIGLCLFACTPSSDANESGDVFSNIDDSSNYEFMDSENDGNAATNEAFISIESSGKGLSQHASGNLSAYEIKWLAPNIQQLIPKIIQVDGQYHVALSDQVESLTAIVQGNQLEVVGFSNLQINSSASNILEQIHYQPSKAISAVVLPRPTLGKLLAREYVFTLLEGTHDTAISFLIKSTLEGGSNNDPPNNNENNSTTQEENQPSCSGVLRLNLYIGQITDLKHFLGLSGATAFEHGFIKDFIKKVDAVSQQWEIPIQIQFITELDTLGGPTPITTFGAYEDLNLGELFASSTMTPKPVNTSFRDSSEIDPLSVNIFLVRSLKVSGQSISGVAIAGHPPGAPGKHAHVHAGVALGVNLLMAMSSKAAAKTAARTALHETMHFMGLFHPQTDAEYFTDLTTPGLGNIMYPQSEASNTGLTQQQRDFICRSSLIH